jgi:hypothetical protein
MSTRCRRPGFLWTSYYATSYAIQDRSTLAMKVQEYFTHAAQLGWFCRAL